jgi:hypothetical protein
MSFPPHRITRCVGERFVSLVQVRATLEVASKKKLLDMPSVPKKPPSGNSSKAVYWHYAGRWCCYSTKHSHSTRQNSIDSRKILDHLILVGIIKTVQFQTRSYKLHATILSPERDSVTKELCSKNIHNLSCSSSSQTEGVMMGWTCSLDGRNSLQKLPL